jgi:hypothetical protein
MQLLIQYLISVGYIRNRICTYIIEEYELVCLLFTWSLPRRKNLQEKSGENLTSIGHIKDVMAVV